ncbi:MAG: hypothetical protein QM689_10890 [Oscillospiraceae bacterium]
MLRKLIKHELRAVYASSALMFLGMLILAVICRIISTATGDPNFESSDNILQTVSLVVFSLSITFLGFYTVILVIKRFKSNLFSDEGYLMNTLPVSVHNLIVSKMIVGIITAVVSSLVITASALIVYINIDYFGSFSDLGDLIRDYLDNFAKLPLLYSGGHLLVVTGSCFCILFAYCCVAVSSVPNKHKNGLFALLFIVLSITFITLFAVYAANMDTRINDKLVEKSNHLNRQEFNKQWDKIVADVYTQFVWVINGVAVALSALFYWVTATVMKKRLNLE